MNSTTKILTFVAIFAALGAIAITTTNHAAYAATSGNPHSTDPDDARLNPQGHSVGNPHDVDEGQTNGNPHGGI